MYLVMLGLSHRTAPVELREQVAWLESDIPDALQRLRQLPGISEAALLSTCNRVEMYVVAERLQGLEERLTDFLTSDRGLPADLLAGNVYFYRGERTVRHLYKVASGLDSLVIGETQILAQVKEFYAMAQEAGTVGKVLHALFGTALSAAKRIHTETGISKNAVSVSYAAVELANKIFGHLNGRRAVLVGAGEVAKLAALHLRDGGIQEILIANRTLERADDLVRRAGGRAIPFQELGDALTNADVVISSTAAEGYVLSEQEIRQVMRNRRNRPLFLLDIAVPRDIDPAVQNLDGIFLYDIDDLKSVVEANKEERGREAHKAVRIIDSEVEAFGGWLRSLDAVPLIKSLRHKAEEIRRAELERALHRLPDLGDRERRVVESLTHLIVNKLLNDPTLRLKEFANEDDSEVYLRAASLLFNLGTSGDVDQEEAAEDSGTQPAAAPKAAASR